ncbi:TPA: cytochrome c3 family protein [Photobacterium damselae]
MKQSYLTILFAIFTFLLGGYTQADTSQDTRYQPTISEKIQHWISTKEGKKTVKPYHQAVHQNGETNCALCHTSNTPTLPPKDKNCLACHGSPEQIAALTERNKNSDHYIEPNPHNSVHYGTDLSCTACHKEHQKSVIYCNNCHKFSYPDMKE